MARSTPKTTARRKPTTAVLVKELMNPQAQWTLLARWQVGGRLEAYCAGRSRLVALDELVDAIDRKHGKGAGSMTTMLKMTELHSLWNREEVENLNARGLSWRRALKLMRFRRVLADGDSKHHAALKRAWAELVHGKAKLRPADVNDWVTRHADKAPARPVHPARMTRLPLLLGQLQAELEREDRKLGLTTRDRKSALTAIDVLQLTLGRLAAGSGAAKRSSPRKHG